MQSQSRSPTVRRRAFLRQSAWLGAAITTAPAILSRAPDSSRLVVGIIGLGRGMGHIQACLSLPEVDIGYVCDVDAERLGTGLQAVQKGQEVSCRGVEDLRRILDDREVDAIAIAACNHWHAPATILGCSAGKHVYVEKPGSHDPSEAEKMVQAARRHERVVQMGNQRRSWPGIREGIQKLGEGAIGRVLYARCWYTNHRGTIGHGREIPPPRHLNYDLWQGPVPTRPYKDNLIHYNWHWHWHWGNGELGNNGVHSLDLARWGLGVDAPLRVTYNAGRYHFADDQETPDTGTAVFDFGECGASWEQSSCHERKPEQYGICVFYGESGRLALQGGGYVIHDPDGMEVGRGSGPGGDKSHFQDFFDAIRNGRKPHAEIEDAQRSTLLCHLGNLAYRTGTMLHFDPATRRVKACPEAAALWSREYRPGWGL